MKSRSAPTLPGRGVVLASLALLVLGCGDSRAAAHATGAAAAQSTLRLWSDANQPLVEKIAAAPFSVAYRGLREVRMRYEVGGQSYQVDYLEEVASNGRGAFSVDPIAVTSSNLDDPSLFLAIQANRAGFVYRYRDFLVRDPERFLANWSVRELAADVLVAGIPCVELRVERLLSPQSHYLARVDPHSGLVLSWEERLSSGELVAQVEYRSIRFEPDLSDVKLEDSHYEATPTELATAEAELGWEPLQPILPPTGFGYESADYFDDDQGRRWLRARYGDGAESLIFLQSPEDTGALGARSDSVVETMDVGPWRLITGTVNGYQVILLGKVPEIQLLEFLQSAL